MFLDLFQEMAIVQVNLTLRLPKPKQIHAPSQGNEDAGVEAIPKSHPEGSARPAKLASFSD